MAFNKGITLYTAGTPNGWKANMITEELKVPYNLHKISLSDNEQKQDWFLKINPNGRIPAIGEGITRAIDAVVAVTCGTFACVSIEVDGIGQQVV